MTGRRVQYYLECASCGALIRVPEGENATEIIVEHNQNADHVRPGANL